MSSEIFRPEIQKMGEYKPPLEGRVSSGKIRLDFNERTSPPHPIVQKEVQKYSKKGEFQSYPEYGDLNEVVANFAGVNPSEVLVTNGGDQAIDAIHRATVGEKDQVIIPIPSFTMFEQSAKIQGAKIITPRYKEEKNFEFPFDDVMESIGKGVKLVVVCNPNNPTGTALAREKSVMIIEKAEENGTAVLFDEAYHEFAPELSVSDLINEHPNLFIVRSFAKSLGIPGLRAGFVITNEQNNEQLKKIRGPYDVNMPVVMALKALRYGEVVEDVKNYAREVMEISKPMVEKAYEELGIKFVPSQAGFHLILEEPELCKFLDERGILVRERSDPKGGVRVSIGTKDVMTKYLKILQEYVASKK